MSGFAEFLLVIAILVLAFFPDIRAKVVAALVTALQLYIIFVIQDPLIDAAIDASVEMAEQINLIDIPDSICPIELNRSNYCVEFGIEKGELNGQVFLTGEINDAVDLRLETKEKILNCPLQKGKACNFAAIKNADDLLITLTDKRGRALLKSSSLIKQVKKYAKILKLAQTGKLINKVI